MKRRKRVRGGGEAWEVVRARGHLDEVQELRAAAPQSAPRSAPPLCALNRSMLRSAECTHRCAGAVHADPQSLSVAPPVMCKHDR